MYNYFCTSAVGIAVYRYLLVCQAVCVHNLGEGRVWRVVSTSVLLLSLLSGALSVHSWADSYMFLLCSGREEHFRSDDHTFTRFLQRRVSVEFCPFNRLLCHR